MPEALDNSDALMAATRRRLELWSLSTPQIERIEKTGNAIASVTIFSPASGFITTRNAFPGQNVGPETELYVIADLSTVWVMADVFESDAAAIRLGIPALEVAWIQPQVDPSTRTLKVRLELNNPGYKLRPDMYVDVVFRIRTAGHLNVPAEAVLDAGTTKTVFVDRGNGHFEPRKVETGRRAGGRVEILKGLVPGERIVTSGAFLLDSESQLKSAMAGMPASDNAAKETHDQQHH